MLVLQVLLVALLTSQVAVAVVLTNLQVRVVTVALVAVVLVVVDLIQHLEQQVRLIQEVAVVGPVVADELRERGINVDLMPESSFFMKPLVRELVKVLG